LTGFRSVEKGDSVPPIKNKRGARETSAFGGPWVGNFSRKEDRGGMVDGAVFKLVVFLSLN
jgi:hypothetical protein